MQSDGPIVNTVWNSYRLTRYSGTLLIVRLMHCSAEIRLSDVIALTHHAHHTAMIALKMAQQHDANRWADSKYCFG
jgi:hypothetical protein